MRATKYKDGMLVVGKNKKMFGEMVATSTRGSVVMNSYFDDCNHYVLLQRIDPLEIIIEPDDGQFYAYVPLLKGCRTCGDSIEEALSNIKDAVRVYVHSMRKHGELQSWNGRLIRS